MYMECEPAGIPVFPPSGKLYAFPANGMPTPQLPLPGGMALMGGTPGAKVTGDIVRSSNKCSLYNYGGKPIINVKMSFFMIYKEAVRNNSGGFTSGKTIVEGDWQIIIPKIDPGSGNQFVFYLFHIGAQFIEVIMPKVATCTILGDDHELNARIDQPSPGYPMFIDPRIGGN
jgi:hypothetical protein